MSRHFFLFLSKNKALNKSAKKWGLRLGAAKVVAGVTIDEVMQSIQQLNEQGLKATIDHLGEFVTEREEAENAGSACLDILEAIKRNNIDSHVSVKLTKLGLDISRELCMENMRSILDVAKTNGNFINIDMEDYAHYHETLDILLELRQKYDNVGTVMQSYLRSGLDDLDPLQGIPLRIVKGAYQEDAAVAYQDKEDIDANFLCMVEKHLRNGGHTAIATHDHTIIEAVQTFTRENNIPTEQFEFQMLYGFRQELQHQLADEGYTFRTYVPFGQDWYGYFMRRLAERPQNIVFAVRGMISK
ncbi:proline dehydrogenase [Salibacterium salarium]|uniref:proline dehydrogenase n=1 Tax=Salibacterium salarium TaxID=284579 RepID=A0A3R9PXK0_9BACI|nr:proline dehydrogenase [Salibacterium salarium]RSL29202.1 proline dehydrogenase [Salibacterium salarium]